jgi:hypothetical protein
MKKFMTIICAIIALGIIFPSQVTAQDTPKEKIAKEKAGWEKTLTYDRDSENVENTLYENSVNDAKNLVVFSATYTPYDENQIIGMTYTAYDSNDKEKLTGSLDEVLFDDETGIVSDGDDAFAQALSGNLAIIRVKAGTWGAYTKDNIYVVKLSKGNASLVGGPVELPLNQTVKIYFVKKKVIISVIVKDGAGTQTDNYVLIYNHKLNCFTKIQGTENTDIFTSTQKITLPKYWQVEDVTYNDAYTETYKDIKIYK